MNKMTILIPISLALAAGCSRVAQNKGGPMNGEEIRTYNGIKLSSVNDFRENSIRGPQKIDTSTWRLEITGLVDTPRTYTYHELLSRQLEKKVITMKCVEGWDVTLLWEGVALPELIKEAGVKPEARIAIFASPDGYSTSLPLSYVMNKGLLLAAKMNGVTIPRERGFPFQLAAEGKWGYKWIKWVSKIELSSDTAYRGFWEQRGYSNDGDERGLIFENQ